MLLLGPLTKEQVVCLTVNVADIIFPPECKNNYS